MDPVLIAGMGMAAFGILTGISACLAFTGKRFARLMDEIEICSVREVVKVNK
jgi:hypothetical protein